MPLPCCGLVPPCGSCCFPVVSPRLDYYYHVTVDGPPPLALESFVLIKVGGDRFDEDGWILDAVGISIIVMVIALDA